MDTIVQLPNFPFWKQLWSKNVCALKGRLKGTPENYFCLKSPLTRGPVLSLQYVGALPEPSKTSNVWRWCHPSSNRLHSYPLLVLKTALALSLFIQGSVNVNCCRFVVNVVVLQNVEDLKKHICITFESCVRLLWAFCFHHVGLVPQSVIGSSTRPWGFIPVPGVSCSLIPSLPIFCFQFTLYSLQFPLLQLVWCIVSWNNLHLSHSLLIDVLQASSRWCDT